MSKSKNNPSVRNQSFEQLKELIREFPSSSGVYIMKNDVEKIIYVGKAKELRSRVRSYFLNSKDISVKTRHLVSHVRAIDYMLTNTEVEAFLLEAALIKKYRPKYNIRLKDDKAYPYIRCSLTADFPRFYLSRKVKNDGDFYYGPYTNGQVVRGIIQFLNKTFLIRDCNDGFFSSRSRPCMTYQIGRCSGPCVELIEKAAYRKTVDSAVDFLRGKSEGILEELDFKMRSLAGDERFEAAAKVRDSIRSIEAIWQKQDVLRMGQEKDQDVISYFGDARGTLIETLHIRAGRLIGHRPHFLPKFDPHDVNEDPREWFVSFLNQYYSDNMIPDQILLPIDIGNDLTKLLQAVLKERSGKICKIECAFADEDARLMQMATSNAKEHHQDSVSKEEHRFSALAEIQSRFQLPHLPMRMECFDISNFQGGESVASQVVFEEGLPKKEDYRRYRIKTVEGSNDFQSLFEALSRRLKRTEQDLPHLLVIDGGKGQLSAVERALKELGFSHIPVVGMAKARTKGSFSDSEVKSSEERFFLPGRQNPVSMQRSPEALRILTQLRDEAHRFAITYHRKLREDRTLESFLDGVEGLGEVRKKALLMAFSSVEAIRAATFEELKAVPEMNAKVAESLMETFRRLLE